MFSTPQNLGHLTSWSQALTGLGLVVQSDLLPFTMRCPFCRQGTLTLYHVSTLGGEWHYCNGCHVCGDTVELCARIAGVGTDTVFNCLASLGVISDDCKYSTEAIQSY